MNYIINNKTCRLMSHNWVSWDPINFEFSPYVPLALFPFPWMHCVTLQGKIFNIWTTNFKWKCICLTLITWGMYSTINCLGCRCILKSVDISLTDTLLKRAWSMNRMWIIGLRLLKIWYYILLFWCFIFISTIHVWHLT